MASVVSAHTHLWSVWVNGEDQGDGRSKYIRSPPNNDPVKDLTSPNLVCNVNGAKAVTDFVSAAAGDELTFEWYHNTRADDIIDLSHKGPIITYVAEYTDGAGTGGIWTKIAEEGYDGSKWAVEKLVSNGGKKVVTIPSSLKAGKYLFRQEIIAHHESDTAYNVNSARGAQFYPTCVQVEITSGGSSSPSENFDFNTGYTYADPGIVFNLYGSYTSYTIPGPAVWTGGDSGSSPAPSSSAAAAPTSSAAAPSTSAAQPITSSPAATQTATPSFTSIVTSASARPTNGGNNGGSPSASSSAAAPSSTKAPSTCAKKRSIRGGARPKL
jgi:cellulase